MGSIYRCMMNCSRNETKVEIYYGLRNETECWCGLNSPANSLLRNDSECNASCPLYDYSGYGGYYGGHSGDYYSDYSYSYGNFDDGVGSCGGPGRTSVYHYESPGYNLVTLVTFTNISLNISYLAMAFIHLSGLPNRSCRLQLFVIKR